MVSQRLFVFGLVVACVLDVCQPCEEIPYSCKRSFLNKAKSLYDDMKGGDSSDESDENPHDLSKKVCKYIDTYIVCIKPYIRDCPSQDISLLESALTLYKEYPFRCNIDVLGSKSMEESSESDSHMVVMGSKSRKGEYEYEIMLSSTSTSLAGSAFFILAAFVLFY